MSNFSNFFAFLPYFSNTKCLKKYLPVKSLQPGASLYNASVVLCTSGRSKGSGCGRGSHNVVKSYSLWLGITLCVISF